ncbi:hypothetical protein B566_EDAN007183 [Ephemera danica]|nr:hypothetical protein B566_EDAN007183 [Ephemera danica]
MALIVPDDEGLKKMKAGFGAGDSNEAEDMAAIKSWFEKQPHLPKIMDDKMMLRFLHGAKYSMERCKQLLDMYFTVRSCAPEFFAERDISSPEMKRALDNTYILPMPKLMSNGVRVTVHGMFHPEEDNFQFLETMKLVFMVGDVRMFEDLCAGDQVVFDMRGSVISHLGQLTLPIVRKFMICGQSAYPSRLQGIHLLNVPSYLDKFLALFKPLMKDKLADRIHVHPDMDSLHKFIEKECLPKEFGGTAGDLKDLNAAWRANLESYREWFNTKGIIKADESKRPGGKPITQDDLFGLDGSFRQLNVD